MRFSLATQQYVREIFLVAILLVTAWLPAVSQGADRGLANVTAAFIYKISKFVIWPESTFKNKDSTVNLCLYGPDQLGLAAILGKLKGKKTQQRPLDVFSVSSESALVRLIKEGQHCHMLYFTNGNINQILKRNTSLLTNTLLVGGNKGFLTSGGMVALILVDKKLNIFINRQALEQSSVKLQARLLMITKTF
ncbi:YfiR family protein [Spartinivicinus ruber]|uniref:YfiR family protein n=1 Tax=Spartinivicinus ruber TaxID=2683272 RepID=UPI0013D0A4B0|nr:YfiR family protein [Spartinivicinus ruber]